MHAHHDLTNLLPGATTVTGGPVVVPRAVAPLGRVLPYRRAQGFGPEPLNVPGNGWTVALGGGALGDTLLALGAVAALYDAVPAGDLVYEGARTELFDRCKLPIAVRRASGAELVRHGSGAARFVADPERPPTWLDILDEQRVQVHAALPMRYYLEVEQRIGLRLPQDSAPAPTFIGYGTHDPWHVVLISATSWPGRKDYGSDGFDEIAQYLTDACPGPWRFTLVPGRDAAPTAPSGVTVADGLDPVGCIDLFATAGVVIGNDTGLTHLAALTERPDATSPHVIGMYARHSHAKWITGRTNHHAVAAPFSHLLTLADRCPVRDGVDDSVWGPASDLRALPATVIAGFALRLLGLR